MFPNPVLASGSSVATFVREVVAMQSRLDLSLNPTDRAATSPA
jgi:hypothetical protein